MICFFMLNAGSCRRLYRKSTEKEIEFEIADTLRSAPHRPGGNKYKVGNLLMILSKFFYSMSITFNSECGREPLQ